MAIMADALGKPIPEVGTTRFRPPFTAVSLGALAAERYGDIKPERLTPMHDWHVGQWCRRCIAAGLWHRPESYNRPGETVEHAYVREAKNVRRKVGIVDVSTLGKIDIQGPDAAEFLNRVYTNNFATLPVGKARYGLMLREDGFALRRRHDMAAFREPVPDDDHDRQCRPDHAASWNSISTASGRI
jgi:hypothetical protein